MTLRDFIERIMADGDGIRYQYISECASKLETRRNGDTRITMDTDPEVMTPTDMMLGTKDGIILWFPSEYLKSEQPQTQAEVSE